MRHSTWLTILGRLAALSPRLGVTVQRPLDDVDPQLDANAQTMLCALGSDAPTQQIGLLRRTAAGTEETPTFGTIAAVDSVAAAVLRARAGHRS